MEIRRRHRVLLCASVSNAGAARGFIVRIKSEVESMTKLKPGTHVTWRWGAHQAEGIVTDMFTRRVRRTIKGKTIIRNGSEAEPVYLVRQGDGAVALKSASELTPA
jgi:hypothetical protein